MAKSEAPIAEMLVTQLELAEYLGLTSRWLRQLTDEGIFQREGLKYNLVQSIAAYVQYKAERESTPKQSSATESLNRRREELLKRQMDREARNLIPLEEAMVAVDGIIGEFLTTISSLPVRLSRDLAERTRIEKILDDERKHLELQFSKRADTVRTGQPDGEPEPEDDAG